MHLSEIVFELYAFVTTTPEVVKRQNCRAPEDHTVDGSCRHIRRNVHEKMPF